MPDPPPLLLGEFRRTVDDRSRVVLPERFARALADTAAEHILAKERPGSLSLWGGQRWQQQLERGVKLVESKMQAGRLDGRIQEVQRLGRLLSTRHRRVRLGARGRLLIPAGFREFLAVSPGEDLLVVGAAVCVEIWNPHLWLKYLQEWMPKFRRLLDKLSA